ncbi:MAG: CDP-glycerol glycerophosphotransferase family protein [Solirubrobacteraceae bacterium]
MTRVLFTGYAHAHFACFRPVYERLRGLAGVEVLLSGGLRRGNAVEGYTYDTDAMYAPFHPPAGAIRTVEEIAELDVDVLVCANTKPIMPRSHGCSVQIFHGLSFRNRAIRPENAGYDYYFVLGPYMHRRLGGCEAFAPDDPRLLTIGFPKTDRLLDGSLDRRAVLAAYGFSGERPVVLYAPTGAHGNSLETMGEELLARLSGQGCYDILVKPHDHPKKPIDWFARLAPLEHEHLRLVRTPDVITPLFAADLLISDASSVANEYALLDRPIVFLDVPELLAAAAVEDQRLDLDTWGRKGGEVAADPISAVAAVARALADPQRDGEARRAMTSDLFYNPGQATVAAVGWLERKLALV